MRVTILCRCECSLPANSLPSKNGPWIRDRYRQSRPVPSGVGESYEEVVLVRIGGLHLHLVPGTAFQRQASCCRGGGGAKGTLVCSRKIDGPVHDPARHTYWFGPFAECSSILDINGDGKLD